MNAPPAERLVIIGSGPAAWTAAVYAARANLAPLVFEGAITDENRLAGKLPLGQLFLAASVENFPGFPQPVLGPELIMKMKEQAESHGARVLTQDVISLDLRRHPFLLADSAGSRTGAHAVVLATGGVIRTLDLPSMTRFRHRGISFCAVSDAPLPRFRNRPVVVIGGGDSAADTALYVARWSNPVYLIHRRDRLRALAPLANEVLRNPRITFLPNKVLSEVLGDERDEMAGVLVRDVNTGREQVIEGYGLFLQIGRRPNSALVRGQVRTDTEGYVILVDPPRTATSVPGVFAAGEVADPVYRQAVTAAATGCQAALDAQRWLAGRGVG